MTGCSCPRWPGWAQAGRITPPDAVSLDAVALSVLRQPEPGERMYQIPVIDLEATLGGSLPAGVLDAIRAAVEQVGIVQVTNHGVDPTLIDEFGQRAGRLLALPRDEKAKLASPGGHPYRGWRQWPDDFGRLELERYNVAQFDTPQDARAGGVGEEYLGLYAHPNVWPADDPRLRAVTFSYIDACRRLAERMLELYALAEGVPAGTFRLG